MGDGTTIGYRTVECYTMDINSSVYHLYVNATKTT